MQSGFKIQCPLVLDDCFNDNGIISVALNQTSSEVILSPKKNQGVTIIEYPSKEKSFILDIQDKMQFLLHQFCAINNLEEKGFEMKIKTLFQMSFWSQSMDPLLLFIFGINKYYKRPMEKRKLLQFLQGNILTDKKCAMGAAMVGGFCIYDHMHQKTHRLLCPQGVTFTLVLSETFTKMNQMESDESNLINLVHGLNMSNWDLIKSGFSSTSKNDFVKEIDKQMVDTEYLGGGEFFTNKGVFFVTCNSRTSDRLEKLINGTLHKYQINDFQIVSSAVNNEGVWLS